MGPQCKMVVFVKISLLILLGLSNVSSKYFSKIGQLLEFTKIPKEVKQKLIYGKIEINKNYFYLISDAKENRIGRAKKGSLKNIIEEVRNKRRMKEDISPLAIRKRFHRNSLVYHHLAGVHVSSLERIKVIIVKSIAQNIRMM